MALQDLLWPNEDGSGSKMLTLVNSGQLWATLANSGWPFSVAGLILCAMNTAQGGGAPVHIAQRLQTPWICH